MVDKKSYILIVLLMVFTISLSCISANVEITKEAVSTLAIKDLNKPAIFKLQITNQGQSDIFTLYSLVGITIEPNESFSIGSGETKEILLKAYPTIPLKISPDYINFEYQIKGDKSGSQKDELAISIANLKDAFDISADSINPDSENVNLHFNNKAGFDYEKISLQLDSAFFSTKQEFALASLEKKNLTIAIDKNKARELLAGPYIITIKIDVEDLETQTTTIMRFEEKPGIETTESNEGILLKRIEVEKTNKGNMNTQASIVISKDLFSSLFTSFDVSPTKTEFSGFKRTYLFETELAPGKSLKVVAKTNWWILIGIIVAVIIIWYLVDRYIKAKLVLEKKAHFVRTKGGEFALKITIKLKARDFIERVKIYDRLPPMVKVFEKFGLGAPDKVDEAMRRLEWNIQALGRGEERTLSYIIYSKIGVVGKFELPQASAVYEFEGNIKDASSNRVFYDNESNKIA